MIIKHKKHYKNNNNWSIEIPKINLKAQIAEGTNKEIMDEYVGHFEETKMTKVILGLQHIIEGIK